MEANVIHGINVATYASPNLSKFVDIINKLPNLLSVDEPINGAILVGGSARSIYRSVVLGEPFANPKDIDLVTSNTAMIGRLRNLADGADLPDPFSCAFSEPSDPEFQTHAIWQMSSIKNGLIRNNANGVRFNIYASYGIMSYIDLWHDDRAFNPLLLVKEAFPILSDCIAINILNHGEIKMWFSSGFVNYMATGRNDINPDWDQQSKCPSGSFIEHIMKYGVSKERYEEFVLAKV